MLSTAKPQWSHDSVEIPQIKLCQTKKYSPRVILKQMRSTKVFNILNFFTFQKPSEEESTMQLRKDQSSANRDVKCGVTWRTRAFYPQCNSAVWKQTKGAARQINTCPHSILLYIDNYPHEPAPCSTPWRDGQPLLCANKCRCRSLAHKWAPVQI